MAVENLSHLLKEIHHCKSNTVDAISLYLHYLSEGAHNLPPPYIHFIMELTRRRSRLGDLADNLKLDVRAHQRTYEGAYTRTAISCLSFSIVMIKLFSSEFLPIGTVYTVYGCLLYFIGVFKAATVDTYYDAENDMEEFKTAGDLVLLLTGISLASYVAMLVLVLRL